MNSIEIRRLMRSRRGQTMVLGVLGVLMVAITMLMTLNMGQAIHERIKLQQYADGAAFSNANQMARAMNFFAYTNRANVGALVAASSAHSYMAMATAVPEQFFTGQTNFYILAAIEFAMCATCCWPYCFSMCKHCIHGIKNLRSASKHGQQGRKLKDKVKKLDKMFINLIKIIDVHMIYIALAQALTLTKVTGQIMQDNLAKDIRDSSRDDRTFLSDKASVSPGGVNAINVAKFVGPFGAVYFPLTAADKSRFLGSEIANASRWTKMVTKRNLLNFILFMHPTQLLDQLLQKCPKPSKGYTFPLIYKGESRVIANPDSPKSEIKEDQHGPNEAQGVGAADEGWVASSAISMCIFSAFMMWKWDVELGSGSDKSEHDPSKYCEGKSKHENMECLDSGSCFMVYNGTEGGDQHQPHAYSLVSQDLSLLNNSSSDRGPWQVNDNGKIKIDLGGSIGMKEVQITDQEDATAGPDSQQLGKGIAMAKAMAYYHFPPDWKEQPNMFAPHWRAKLQPMRIQEAALVMGAGGVLGKYQAMVAGPLP